MPVITELSRTVVLLPDESVDSQKRLAGTLAGERGSTVAETTGEYDPALEEHQGIGFKPPSRRKEQPNQISDLFAAIHEFVNAGKPASWTPTPEQPQGS